MEDVSSVRAPLSFQLNELLNKELCRVLLLACSFLALVSGSGSGSIFNIDPQNSLVASGNATRDRSPDEPFIAPTVTVTTGARSRSSTRSVNSSSFGGWWRWEEGAWLSAAAAEATTAACEDVIKPGRLVVVTPLSAVHRVRLFYRVEVPHAARSEAIVAV